MALKDEDAADRNVRSPWSRGAKWLAGAFAIAVNVVSIVDIAVNNRLVVSAVTGLLAIVGGVWVWRQPRDRSSRRARRQAIALSAAMIVTGTGVVGYVLARQLSGEARRPPSVAAGPSTSALPSPTGGPSSAGSTSPLATASPSTARSGPTGAPPTSTEPDVRKPGTPTAASPTGSITRARDERPFTGTIVIRQPQFGWTLASGQNLNGEVTGWTTGYQVWMSARAEGSSTELIQGPCPVNGTTFVCSEVELPGPTGTREYILVAVLTDGQAAHLSDASPLLASNASASDQTQVYKG